MNYILRTFCQVIDTLTDRLSAYACKTKVYARDIWTVEAEVDTGSIPGLLIGPRAPYRTQGEQHPVLLLKCHSTDI